MRRTLALLPVVLLAASCGPRLAVAEPATFPSEHYALEVTTVADELVHPWGMTFLPDGRMLVTEREGRLRVVTQDGEVSEPVAGVPEVWNQGQGGLLDVALHPDYAENRLVYVSYSEPAGGGPSGDVAGTAVARGKLDPDAPSLTDVEVIFRQKPKVRASQHFGSRLVFSPDGKLFVTLGERGERPKAQDTSVNRGQVVRINPDGSIPEDNPFVGREGHLPEIWSYGHRNPQGAALHPGTGELWIHEHGARGGDEVNVPEAGRNYGWPVIAYGQHYVGGQIGVGTHKEGMEQPIYYWDPSIAPSGMAFYTGDKFPEWQGDLLVGALKFRLLARLELDGRKVTHEERMLDDLDERIRAVTVGPDGYVYLLTDDDPGRVLRVAPVGG